MIISRNIKAIIRDTYINDNNKQQLGTLHVLSWNCRVFPWNKHPMFFHMKMGCGHQMNTCAKLLELWGLMFFASVVGVPSLSLYGDSKVIVDRANNSLLLQVMDLEQRCLCNFWLLKSFISLSVSYVFREHNALADKLSKPWL